MKNDYHTGCKRTIEECISNDAKKNEVMNKKVTVASTSSATVVEDGGKNINVDFPLMLIGENSRIMRSRNISPENLQQMKRFFMGLSLQQALPEIMKYIVIYQPLPIETWFEDSFLQLETNSDDRVEVWCCFVSIETSGLSTMEISYLAMLFDQVCMMDERIKEALDKYNFEYYGVLVDNSILTVYVKPGDYSSASNYTNSSYTVATRAMIFLKHFINLLYSVDSIVYGIQFDSTGEIRTRMNEIGNFNFNVTQDDDSSTKLVCLPPKDSKVPGDKHTAKMICRLAFFKLRLDTFILDSDKLIIKGDCPLDTFISNEGIVLFRDENYPQQCCFDTQCVMYLASVFNKRNYFCDSVCCTSSCFRRKHHDVEDRVTLITHSEEKESYTIKPWLSSYTAASYYSDVLKGIIYFPMSADVTSLDEMKSNAFKYRDIIENQMKKLLNQ